jgi:hypothetical protein
MSARKRSLEEEPGRVIPYHHFGIHRPKRDDASAAAPETDIWPLPVEGISPAFDRNRALLRRLFFFNDVR